MHVLLKSGANPLIKSHNDELPTGMCYVCVCDNCFVIHFPYHYLQIFVTRNS